MRLPTQLELGPWVLHLDVLVARLQRRRRRLIRHLVSLLVLSVLAGGAWLGRPWIIGVGYLVLTPDPETAAAAGAVTVVINDRPLPDPTRPITLTAGRHTVRFTRPAHFPQEQTIRVTRQQTTTITLPTLRPRPVIQAIPVLNGQVAWQQATPDAGGGWRLRGRLRDPDGTPTAVAGWGPPVVAPPPTMLVHLDDQGLTRMPILETAPVADEVRLPSGTRVWALWEPHTAPLPPGTPLAAGTLTLETPQRSQVISTTTALSGLWWSPGGRYLLIAVPGTHGHSLSLVDLSREWPDLVRGSFAPLLTLPGTVQSVQWHPAAAGVVVVSTLTDTTTPPAGARSQPATVGQAARAPAVLPAPAHALAHDAVLLVPATQDRLPQAVRLPSAPIRPLGLLPLAWSPGGLWWTTDTGLGLALDYVDLTSGVRTRRGSLPDSLVALTVLADDQVRTLVQTGTTLTVQTWPDNAVLFPLDLPDVTGPLGGQWYGDAMLLTTGTGDLWTIGTTAAGLR